MICEWCCEYCRLIFRQVDEGVREGTRESVPRNDLNISGFDCFICQALSRFCDGAFWKTDTKKPAAWKLDLDDGEGLRAWLFIGHDLQDPLVLIRLLRDPHATAGIMKGDKHIDEYVAPTHSSDPAVARLARSWLRECFEKHQNFRRSDAITDFRPRCFISLRPGNVRLVSGSDCNEQVAWATLSHCRGLKPDFIRLDSGDIKTLQHSISLEVLAPTFRDPRQSYIDLLLTAGLGATI